MDVSDPYAKLSPAQALAAIDEGEANASAPALATLLHDELKAAGGERGAANMAAKAVAKAKEQAVLGAVSLCAARCQPPPLSFLPRAAATVIVALDLSRCGLRSLDALGNAGMDSLRKLVAMHNEFDELPALKGGLLRVLSMDLSFNVGIDIQPNIPGAAAAALQQLTLASCELESLGGGKGVGAFRKLRYLDVSDNELESVATLKPLAAALSLEELICEENEDLCAAGSAYRRRVAELLPRLMRLDGDSLKLGSSGTKASSSDFRAAKAGAGGLREAEIDAPGYAKPSCGGSNWNAEYAGALRDQQ